MEELRQIYKEVCNQNRLNEREDQVAMIQNIHRYFNSEDKTFYICEAGTGTGKSLAFLIAAGYTAKEKKTSVVIATPYVELQHQMLKEWVKYGLDKYFGKIAIVKGKTHYFDRARFQRWINRTKNSAIRSILEHIYSLAEQYDGDFEAVYSMLSSKEKRELKSNKINIEDCTLSLSQQNPESTFWYKQALEKAQGASVIVTNHFSVFTAYFYGGNKDFLLSDYLIFDEAHVLPEQAAMFLSQSSAIRTLKFLLEDLYDELKAYYVNQTKKGKELRPLINLTSFFIDTTDNFIKYAQQYFHRVKQKIIPVQKTDIGLLSNFVKLISNLENLIKIACKYDLDTIKRLSDFYTESESVVKAIQSKQYGGVVLFLAFSEKFNYPSFVKVNPLVKGFLNFLWARCKYVVFSSATLYDPYGKIDGFKNYVGINFLKGVVVDDRFKGFKKQGTVYLYPNLPMPELKTEEGLDEKRIEYYSAILPTLVNIAKDKKSLILIPAHVDTEIISEMLANNAIEHMKHIPPDNLAGIVKVWKKRNCPLITASAWTGIDIPQKDSVVIPRVPFASPDDPMVVAKKLSGRRNVFQEERYKAFLQLRQGIGRAIRAEDEKTEVHILDSRVERLYPQLTKMLQEEGYSIVRK